jgi:hypothetical protein
MADINLGIAGGETPIPANAADRVAQEAHHRSLIDDPRTAMRNGDAATQRVIASLLRMMGMQHERIVVLEDAARRHPEHRQHFEAAQAARAKLLVPRTKESPPRPLPAEKPKPQPLPEPKSKGEIPAYVAALRGHSATLLRAAARAVDDAEKARLGGLAQRLETRIASWEAKLADTALAKAKADPPADSPHNKLSPDEKADADKSPDEREQQPADWFLDEAVRRYPWKVDGKPDRDLLIAAGKHAAAEKERGIEDKVKALLQKHFPEKPAAKAAAKPAAARSRHRWL